MLENLGYNEFRGNAITDDVARMEAGQPLMRLEPAVEISYTKIKKYFGLWEKKIIRTRGYRQKAIYQPMP